MTKAATSYTNEVGKRIVSRLDRILVNPIEGHEHVYAARQAVKNNELKPPFLINVKPRTGAANLVHGFYYDHSGMYSVQYAQLNWYEFPVLREIRSEVTEDELTEINNTLMYKKVNLGLEGQWQ